MRSSKRRISAVQLPQEQLQPRKCGQFSDLADPDALGKLCRVFCEERGILELLVSNRMSIVGVDTVGRPGLASGTDGVPDCAGQS